MLTSVVLLLVGSDNCERYPNAKIDEEQKRYKETSVLDIKKTQFEMIIWESFTEFECLNKSMIG